jgi:isoleucyl-tRNA synthetase
MPTWPKVNPKQNFPELEEEVLKYWQENKIFEESVEREPRHGDFVFYDGPPFATGLPHYGHILQSVIKDLVPRYKTMQGYRVPRRWGWDCHGLPVENLIEKELGLKSKQDIETLGVDKFNAACEASVLRYADEWKAFIPRMGRWVDMENDYKTMNPAYMESVWWVFKNLWDKGLIYEGLKPMHICPRCVTPLSNFEVGLGYKDVTDLSAIAKFRVRTNASEPAYPALAFVIIRDETGAFLVGEKTKSRKLTFPGGNLEPGETVAEAAKREALEEAEIEIETEKCFAVRYKSTGKPLHALTARITAGRPTDTAEVKNWRWLSLAELQASSNLHESTALALAALAEGAEAAESATADEPPTYLLAWTTTPWTLPGNVALAVNPEVEYVKVRVTDSNDQTYNLIVKEENWDEFFYDTLRHATSTDDCKTWEGGATRAPKPEFKSISPIEFFKGSDLVGLNYEPLFPYFFAKQKEGAFRVVAADFVSTDSGTGIVHIAPAFGEDDMNVAKKENLPTIQHVTMEGKFTSEVTDFAGLDVKPADDPRKTDQKIIDWLNERGLLFQSEKIKHSYPYCWRCDTPLLNFATSSWFVAVEKIKTQLLKNNEKINWVPEHVKAGRFGKWLEGARDWAISRNRYWGAPLPIWRCDTTGETICVGSAAELEKLSGQKVADFHKQFVDEITWENKKAADKAVEITFVRHGQTDWNGDTKRMQGRTDNPLNETGKEQATEKRSEINHADYDVIITSPLVRAHETAEILAPGREIVVDEAVIEKNLGDFEGMTYEEIYEKYPDFKNTADIRYKKDTPSGETHADMLARIRSFVEKIKRDHAGKRVLVVCHGIVLRYFIYLAESDEAILDTELPNIHAVTQKLAPTFRRIPEVLDCWFESGSMPYAQDATKGETKLPANFIAEAQDQTRGWFYTLHVLGTALFDKPAFENCITSGLILAEDGQKMSKSKKNYPDPNELIHKHGADAMRLYLMNSPVVRGEALRFSERGVEETLRGVLLPLWNTYYFFTTYATADGWTGGELPMNSTSSLDRWILSELNILIRDMTAALDHYELQEAVRPLVAFMDGLTNWYIRRSRRRFWKSESDTDKNEAYATLLHVLTTVSQLLAPVCPFLAEEIYRGLTGEKSVHLADWPTADEKRIDEALSEETKIVRTIISLGLAIRAREDRKVRQPLARATIALPSSLCHPERSEPASAVEGSQSVQKKDSSSLAAPQNDNFGLELDTIREELNVKELVFAENPDEIAKTVVTVNARALGPRLGGKVQDIIREAKAGNFEVKDDGVHVGDELLTGDEVSVGFEGKEGLAAASEAGIVVALDIGLTPELEREGTARDLVREIQELRKKADLEVSDRIQLSISGADEILKAWAEYIQTETLATELVKQLENPAAETELDGVKIAIQKVSA